MARQKTKNNKQSAHVFGYNEADDVWYAQSTSASGASSVSEEVTVDTPEYFEDTNFLTNDSPVTLDINTALGTNATTTTVINDGPGSFSVQYSTDGVSFGDSITLKQREQLELRKVSVDSIKITWIANSAYRVIAI